MLKKSDFGTFPTTRSPITTIHLQQAFTGDPFSRVSLGNVDCTVVRRATNDTCFGPQSCVSTPAVVTLPATTAPLRFASDLFRLTVIFAPDILVNSLCTATSVVAAAVVMTDAMLVTYPVYRYAYLAFGATASNMLLRSTSSEASDAAVLSWLEVDGWWNSSANGPLFLSDIFANASFQDASESVPHVGQLFTFVPQQVMQQPSSTSSTPVPFNETEVPRLERGSDARPTSTVYCSISDPASFAKFPITAGTDLSEMYTFACGSSVATAAFYVDLQTACASDSRCVGYTVRADNTPLCLLYAGHGFDPSTEATRWLHLKPPTETRTCSAIVGGNSTANPSNASSSSGGTIDVFVRQTYLSESAVSVFVDNNLVKQCGGRRPFAGGYLGHSSACGLWYLCYSADVAAGTMISVRAEATMAAGDCDSAVGIVFNMSFHPVHATPAPGPPLVPINLTVQSLRQSFPNRVYLRVLSRRFVSVFVINSARVVMSVVQTGYSCDIRSCISPSIVVGTVFPNGTSIATLQACGGSLPFVLNQSGRSDQCSSTMLCGLPAYLTNQSEGEWQMYQQGPAGPSDMSSSAVDSAAFTDGSHAWEGQTAAESNALAGGSFFSGWVRISLDMPSIRSGSSLCPIFEGALHASSQVNDTESSFIGISGFALHVAPGQFQVLLSPLAGTSLQQIALLVGGATEKELVPLSAVSQVLSPTDPRDAYLLVSIGNRSSALTVNASLACVMDWISTDSASCTIPVPAGANFMTLKVAQTNFASATMTVEFRDEFAVTRRTVICGGKYGFAGFTGFSDRCQEFLRCGSGFFPAGANVSQIRIVVPSAVGDSQSCTVAFAATADFQQIDRPVPQGCPFLCSSDRTCIAASSVCDGVVDCSDGADEDACKDWTFIEAGGLFPNSNAVQLNVSSFRECRDQAVLRLSRLLAINTNYDQCLIFSTTDSTMFLAAPDAYISESSQFSMHSRLTAPYPRCSSATTCTRHGAVIKTNISGKILCSCACMAGWSGSDCGTKLLLTSTGPIAIALPRTTGLTPTKVEILLIAAFTNTSDISVSCSPFFLNGDEIYVTMCIPTSANVGAVSSMNAAILALGALAKLRAVAGNDEIIAIGLTTQPLPQSASCHSNSNGEPICSFGNTPVQLVFASMTSTPGLDVIDFAIAQSSGNTLTNSRRSGNATTSGSASGGTTLNFVVNSSSDLLNTRTPSGCSTTTTTLNLNGLTINTIASSTPGYNSTSDACYKSMSMQFTSILAVPKLIQAFPHNVEEDFSPFLISGIALIVTAAVCIGGGALMIRWHNRALRQEIHELELQAETPLKALIALAHTAASYLKTQRLIRHEKWSAVMAIAALDLTILGVFLTLYFSTSRAQNSNVEVILETYSTSECSASLLSPMPIRMAYIEAWSARVCREREAAGAELGVIVAAGYCDNSSGTPVVLLKLASGIHDCEAQDYVVYPYGSCVPIQLLQPYIKDASYMEMNCGTVDSVYKRFAYAQHVALQPDGDSVRPRTPPISLLEYGTAIIAETLAVAAAAAPSFSNSQPHSSPVVFTYPRLNLNTLYNTTSIAPYRFEAVASSSALVGTIAPKRLLFQHPIETFVTGEDLPETASVELAVDLRNISDKISAFGPLNGDYPVGFLFNDFGGPNELSRSSAGSGAARYYGVAGSLADVGRYFSSHGPDGSGFTISLYLRVTRRTEGFAFAVADGREDVTNLNSPLLNRMLTMISNSNPGSAWYDATYGIYTSLYIDGPGAALRFIFANSGGSSNDPVVNLVWDVSALGLMRLFNGAWHAVAIIIRNENGRVKAQLIVDGATSESIIGWNQCVSRPPLPIQRLNISRPLPVLSAIDERIFTQGILFTGYLNGGVARLEFINRRVTIYELWKTSTVAIRDHYSINVSGFIALAVLVFLAGIVMFILMIRTSAMEILAQQAVKAEDEQAHCFDNYVALWKQRPRDPQGVLYMPVPFMVAKSWLGLDNTMLAIFLDQLKYNFKNPADQFVRLVYGMAVSHRQGEPDLSLPSPTNDEWRTLIEEEEDKIDAEEGEDTSNNSSIGEQSADDSGHTAPGASSAQPHDDQRPLVVERRRRTGSRRNVLAGRSPQSASSQLIAIVPSSLAFDGTAGEEESPFRQSPGQADVWSGDESSLSDREQQIHVEGSAPQRSVKRRSSTVTGEGESPSSPTVAETGMEQMYHSQYLLGGRRRGVVGDPGAEAALSRLRRGSRSVPEARPASLTSVVLAKKSSLTIVTSLNEKKTKKNNNTMPNNKKKTSMDNNAGAMAMAGTIGVDQQTQRNSQSGVEANDDDDGDGDDDDGARAGADKGDGTASAPADAEPNNGGGGGGGQQTENSAKSYASPDVEDNVKSLQQDPPTPSNQASTTGVKNAQLSVSFRDQTTSNPNDNTLTDEQEISVNRNSHHSDQAATSGAGAVNRSSALPTTQGGGTAAQGGQQQSSSESGSPQDHGHFSGSDLGQISGDITEMIQSCLFVVQSVAVWFSSMEMPSLYFDTFSAAFAAFSADITMLLRASPLVTPLVQFFLAMVIFAVLFYFVDEDEHMFLQNVSRYAMRRDEIAQQEMERSGFARGGVHEFSQQIALSFRRKSMVDMSDSKEEMTTGERRIDIFGEVAGGNHDFSVPLLPLSDAQKIDIFIGRVKVPQHEDLTKHATLVVHDLQHREYTLQKLAIKNRVQLGEIKVTSNDVSTTDLREVGHCCPLHVGRALGVQMQSDVWPYESRPSCCVQINGARCNMSFGQMFVCGHNDTNDDGEPTRCLYALCQRHYSASFIQRLRAPVLTLMRSARNRGFFWIVASMFLILANIGYTPILKTALLIVACDPYYQCDFTTCWSAPDRLFVLAAYLCIVLITCYGLGFPLAMFTILRRRHRMLELIFFSEEYDGQYSDASRGGVVKMAEWRRYSITDPTALGRMYHTYELQWIYVAPILLFWKAAALAPVVFIERNSFNQLLGTAIVQFLFGVFLFVTEPSISPTVDLIYKLGATHQMLLLGTMSLERYQEFVSGGKSSLATVSIGITAVYLFLCMMCMGLATFLPILMTQLQKKKATVFLQKMGMQYSATTAMYVVPSLELSYRCKECSSSSPPTSTKEVELSSLTKDGDLINPLGGAVSRPGHHQQQGPRRPSVTWHGLQPSASEKTLSPTDLFGKMEEYPSIQRVVSTESFSFRSPHDDPDEEPLEASWGGSARRVSVSFNRAAVMATSVNRLAKAKHASTGPFQQQSLRTSFSEAAGARHQHDEEPHDVAAFASDDDGEDPADHWTRPATSISSSFTTTGRLSNVRNAEREEAVRQSFALDESAASIQLDRSGSLRRAASVRSNAANSSTSGSGDAEVESRTRMTEEALLNDLNPQIIRALSSHGYSLPADAQLLALTHMRQGRDVLVLASEGINRSLTAAIGLLHRLNFADPLAVTQCVVICPSRDAAVQAFDMAMELGSFLGDGSPFVHLCTGQNKIAHDIRQLQTGQTRIAIGTLSRINDLICRGALRAHSLRTVLLMGADELLKPTNDEAEGQIYTLLRSLPPQNSQRIVFAKRDSRQVVHLVDRFLQEPARFDLRQDESMLVLRNSSFSARDDVVEEDLDDPNNETSLGWSTSGIVLSPFVSTSAAQHQRQPREQAPPAAGVVAVHSEDVNVQEL